MSTHVPTYPVHVEGRLDPRLSRGLWLVKWLLVIPHYVVLAFLWLAFCVVSVFAFFAILFTGRYPRGLFDFNVGVLRWTWRVGFYAFSANGTDRYPPFTLKEVEYPATLQVDYPEGLSRGLVLVKWWLLAIPHYLIVAVFAGGGVFAWSSGNWAARGWAGGLIGLLVLIAVVALLFTGRYPGGIFDLVLGLNRWTLRVAAYAALMTDVYPPFRLDTGPSEPGVTLSPPEGAAPVAPAATGTSTSGVVMLIVAALIGLFSLASLAGAGVLLWADQTQRDSGGFLMSSSERLTTATYGITAGYQRTGDALSVRSLALDVNAPSWLFASNRLGTLRIRANPVAGRPLFVGIAPARIAAGYLATIRHDSLTGFSGGSAHYTQHTGGAPASPPTAQPFWTARATGSREVVLTWPVRHGSWTIVVMNADGSAGVAADTRLGARLAFLGELAAAMLIAAVVFAVPTALLARGGARRLSPPPGPTP